MAMTTVDSIQWVIKNNGRIVPRLMIRPVNIPGPCGHVLISRVHAHNAWWLLEKNAGVGAHIFLDTPQRFSVNLKAVPDVPQNCLCGSAIVLDGRHIKCPNELCEFRGNGIIHARHKIFWVKPE